MQSESLGFYIFGFKFFLLDFLGLMSFRGGAFWFNDFFWKMVIKINDLFASPLLFAQPPTAMKEVHLLDSNIMGYQLSFRFILFFLDDILNLGILLCLGNVIMVNDVVIFPDFFVKELHNIELEAVRILCILAHLFLHFQYSHFLVELFQSLTGFYKGTLDFEGIHAHIYLWNCIPELWLIFGERVLGVAQPIAPRITNLFLNLPFLLILLSEGRLNYHFIKNYLLDLLGNNKAIEKISHFLRIEINISRDIN